MDRRAFLKPLPLVLFSAAADAASWSQWRGPARDGKSAETGLLKRWPANGPELVWAADGLGAGYSSFSVEGGKLYTQGQRDGRQFLMAFDTSSGAKLWETENGKRYLDGRGDGPRGTPTIDGDSLYAISGSGNLICAAAETGKTNWQIDLLGQFGARNISWGISESPLIDGDRVIATPGGRDAGVVALNKLDGGVVWKSESQRAGYSSAVSAVMAGVHQYVLLTASGGVGVRAADGKLLWRYAKVANGTANVATPIVSGDKVFLSSDYGTGCALLQISPNGTGGVQAEEVYFSREMRNHYSTSVLLDGKLLQPYIDLHGFHNGRSSMARPQCWQGPSDHRRRLALPARRGRNRWAG
ncbi:MAG: PQQ-like beta-propeller repeat protein [Acidobacteria bacterium]|nr:PQQ-like beta-propeller repeat protein [Acidobacteriota bacterium]